MIGENVHLSALRLTSTMATTMPVYSAGIPSLTEEQIDVLIENIKDYQITHGSLLKVVQTREKSALFTRGIPVSLFPSQFPRASFHEAIYLQRIFNELYVKVASDEEFLETILQPLIKDDAFTRCLWDIHLAAREAGIVQGVSLGIFRSDYMIHAGGEDAKEWQLKQVEFNTFSVAGSVHANLVADMHGFLHKTGAYGNFFGDFNAALSSVPVNSNINGVVKGLVAAHRVYGSPRSEGSKRTGILFIVQHNNYNICDERPLEYALWNQDPPIPAYRLAYRDIMDHVSLGPSRELLFTSPSCPFSPLEIAVVYFRAGYDPEEYDEKGRAARLLLETSLAIKCPSILSQLTTFKKVQQELSAPGALERFLLPAQCAEIRATFAPMYPLDKSELGLQARAFATNPETAVEYILKPSLEGGGHNIYGSDIPDFLETVPEEQWSNLILMKMIASPTQEGSLMSSEGWYQGPTVSELGVFGVCLWRRGTGNGEVEVLENADIGWSFKTKPEEVEEMSVVKGYGFFDSPLLIQ
jgi:glutathione synthetase